jgi:glycosyltransferase involved in cell wall biosynthesis
MNKNTSVIIPVKNRADLLPYTLNNILGQSTPPSEIIVVDDNSTDNLSSVAKKYKGRVIFLSNNGNGPGAARNRGFEASTGNYIQFFDSDDIMTKNKLEVQSDILSASGNGMVYSPHVKALQTNDGTWQRNDVILYYIPLSKKYRYDQWVLRGACMITQSCLFDREIFKETGIWRTDLMPHEDLEFLFRIGKAVPYPEHTDKAAVIYRQHGKQITDKMLKNNDRAMDQANAWNMIKQNMSKDYSVEDNFIVELNILNNIHFLDNKNLLQKFKIKESLLHKCGSLFYKIKNKYNRIVTGSDWQMLHGISDSEEIFQKYISNLS